MGVTQVWWHAGVQLAKMTPFRSAVVMAYTALSVSILALLQFKGGVITYVIVSPLPADCLNMMNA